MARKDTFKALLRRGIDEATADKLLQGYSSITDIAAASAADMVALGLTEAQAAEVSKLLGKAKKEGVKKAEKKEGGASQEDRVPEGRQGPPRRWKRGSISCSPMVSSSRRVSSAEAGWSNLSEPKIKEILLAAEKYGPQDGRQRIRGSWRRSPSGSPVLR